MKRLIQKHLLKRVSTTGLGVFRFLFCLVLFFEVLFIYRHKELYYGQLPDLTFSNTYIPTLLLCWLLILLLLAFGVFTRITAIVNYVLAVYLLGSFPGTIYHMAYTYLGASFLFVCLPVGRSFSVDDLWRRKRAENLSKPNMIHVWAYYLTILIGVGVVYLDSILFKVKSDVWTNGLGLWLPASLPHFSNVQWGWLLNQKYVLLFFGYLTFAFELVFPVTFFLKRMRIPLFVVGFMLHLGILIFFPIPYFALGVLALYVLLLPIGWWDQFQTKVYGWFGVGASVTKITPLVSRKPRNKKVIIGYGLLTLLLLLFQFNASFNFPFSGAINSRLANYPEYKEEISFAKEQKKAVRQFSKKHLGITPHGVFVDNHYRNFDELYALQHHGKILPMFDEKGAPGPYLQGGLWVHYLFRVNRSIEVQSLENLKDGLSRYGGYWIQQQSPPESITTLTIVRKKVAVTFQWQKDWLQKNLDYEWEEVGELIWDGTTITMKLWEETAIKKP